MAKDTFYFSHDFNARNDIKIKKLIAKHGYLGYGLFWAIVEELYNNTNVLPNDYECIAYDLRTDANVIKSIVNDFDLFEIDNESFGSLSIQRRLNERNEKSKKARESVLKRWNKSKEDTNVLQTKYDSNTIKERKGKENKVIDINISMDDFWDLYDKKVGDKIKIEKKWIALRGYERVKAMDYIPNYKISQPDKKYRLNPETFINQKGWNNEIIGLEEIKKKSEQLPAHLTRVLN
jgi:hypothetical protein